MLTCVSFSGLSVTHAKDRGKEEQAILRRMPFLPLPSPFPFLPLPTKSSPSSTSAAWSSSLSDRHPIRYLCSHPDPHTRLFPRPHHPPHLVTAVIVLATLNRDRLCCLGSQQAALGMVATADCLQRPGHARTNAAAALARTDGGSAAATAATNQRPAKRRHGAAFPWSCLASFPTSFPPCGSQRAALRTRTASDTRDSVLRRGRCSDPQFWFNFWQLPSADAAAEKTCDCDS